MPPRAVPPGGSSPFGRPSGLPAGLDRRSACCATALVLAGCASPATDLRDRVLGELGAPGRLRAAINFGNPLLARRGPAGDVVGISVDLAREAARQLGLPADLVTFSSAGPVLEAIRTRQVDLAFVAIDPARAADMDYTAPYVVIEGAFLVRNDSPVQHNDEVDRPGHRIVAARGSTYDLHLTRTLKAASLVHAPTAQTVTDLLLAQRLDVAAGLRQQLEADARRVGGVRLLPGRFLVIEQAMGMPKRRPASQAWLGAFIERVKASGFVADALRRHGSEGATVAPPGA